MELIFIVCAGLLIGGCAQAWMPGSELRGAFLLPGLATITITVLWEAMTWLGMSYGELFIWAISIGLTVAITFGTALYLTDSRKLADARLSSKR